MATVVNVRALQREPSRILRQLEEGREPIFVRRGSDTVAVLVPADDDILLDYAARHVPGFLPSEEQMRAEVERGETATLGEFEDELEAEDTRLEALLRQARALLTERNQRLIADIDAYLAAEETPGEVRDMMDALKATVDAARKHRGVVSPPTRERQDAPSRNREDQAG
jgi:antitoxin (DNA-binding transcriptional repressor) of toxin-antitoxin stability system